MKIPEAALYGFGAKGYSGGMAGNFQISPHVKKEERKRYWV